MAEQVDRQKLAETVREALETLPEMPFVERNPDGDDQARDSMRVVARDGIAALTALVAQVERLEQERGEARAERSTLYQRGDDFAHDVWKERAVAAEARAEQAESERDAIHRAYVEQCSYTTAANTFAQRYRQALRCVFLDPLASGGARAVAREALGIPFIPFATPQEMIDAAAATRE